MRVQHEHEVVDSGDGSTREATATTSHWAFGPGQLIGGAVGVVASVFGVLAITRGGIDGTLNEPVVSAAGFGQSALVGIIELVLGLLLIAGAATVWNRSLMGFGGGVMIIGGIIIAASSGTILRDLGTDHRTGWLVMIGGIVAMVAVMLPTFPTSTRRDRQTP